MSLIVWLIVWLYELHPRVTLWNAWAVALGVCLAYEVVSIGKRATSKGAA